MSDITKVQPKLLIDQRDLEIMVEDICISIEDDGWAPDLIAGIGRGGLIPAVMISHYFDKPLHALHWSTRDHVECVSEAALAEDIAEGLKVLVVDDICDSGQTLSSMFADWESCVHTDLNLGEDVRIATLHYRKSCDYEVDYIGEFVDDEWVVYPWESWWG